MGTGDGASGGFGGDGGGDVRTDTGEDAEENPARPGMAAAMGKIEKAE